MPVKTTPLMQTRLARAVTGARKSLDRMGDLLPAPEHDLPFDEYMARASLQAQQDPAFGHELQRSLLQYGVAQRKVQDG